MSYGNLNIANQKDIYIYIYMFGSTVRRIVCNGD